MIYNRGLVNFKHIFRSRHTIFERVIYLFIYSITISKRFIFISQFYNMVRYEKIFVFIVLSSIIFFISKIVTIGPLTNEK